MLIGVDLDEVLMRFRKAFFEWHGRMYSTSIDGEKEKRYYIDDILGISRAEADKLVREFYLTDYFIEVYPVVGAVEGTKQLGKNNDLVVVTSRTQDLADVTLDQINRNYNGVFSNVYFSRTWSVSPDGVTNKGELCVEYGINVMIEDYAKYAVDCAKHNIRTLLLDRPWNEDYNLLDGVERVYSWDEIVEKIKNGPSVSL